MLRVVAAFVTVANLHDVHVSRVPAFLVSPIQIAEDLGIFRLQES